MLNLKANHRHRVENAFKDRITVVHDGIDTQAVMPNPQACITLNGELNLRWSDELVTFVNRNLEPCRGCHIFMRALPDLLRRRPIARILIVGVCIFLGRCLTSSFWLCCRCRRCMCT